MSRVLPILFNTDMVWAILDGRKMVTRRVMKEQPPAGMSAKKIDGIGFYWAFWEDSDKHWLKCPYDVGDILYVRETWCWCPCWDCGFDTEEHTCCYEAASKTYNHEKVEWGCYGYKASFEDNEYPSADTWHPSIHMPKKAARIWLRVTDVRVERLQDITEEQAKLEGFINDINLGDGTGKSAAKHFADLWDSTIKKTDLDCYGWSANPWVWVIEFERCEKPEHEKAEWRNS